MALICITIIACCNRRYLRSTKQPREVFFMGKVAVTWLLTQLAAILWQSCLAHVTRVVSICPGILQDEESLGPDGALDDVPAQQR